MMVDGIKVKHTAYDDAFRTLEAECDDALILFINAMFHEDFDNTAKIVRLRNEHFVEEKGKTDEKRITDSHFQISCHGEEKMYQLECESSGYDDSVLVRMFEYAVQAALSEKALDKRKITLHFPRSGLLVLRNKGNPPEKVTFEIRTPGGTVSYDAPVICAVDYTIEELFERKLYFLLPFFVFQHEDRMNIYEEDEKELENFLNIYCGIVERLRLEDESVLSLRSKGVIIKQMEYVTKRLNVGRKKVIKKVGDIMGGKVLKMEWLERFDAAVAGGEARGEEIHLIKMICRKLRKGKNVGQIAEDLEEDEIRIKAICDMAKAFAPEYDEEQVIKAVLEPVAAR